MGAELLRHPVRPAIIRLFEQGKRKIAELNVPARIAQEVIKRFFRHQPTKKQRRMATQFTRFKRYGLLNVEHFGGGSMLEAPSVDR